VFGYSQGIPRLVNAICDKALLAGFVERSYRINYGWWGRPSANWKEYSLIMFIAGKMTYRVELAQNLRVFSRKLQLNTS